MEKCRQREISGKETSGRRKRRARRPLPGMLLHIDGSQHPCFQDERWYDLIVILDDATSEIYYAQLTEEESRFSALYTVIAAAISGLPRRREARSIRSG